MRYFIQSFLKGALGLTAALVMAATLPVQAAPTPGQASLLFMTDAPQTGVLLLAQNTEPPKEKQPSPPPPSKEPKKMRTGVPQPCPQMERMDKSVIRDEPGKAGTKKFGGQAIRAKEDPQGE